MSSTKISSGGRDTFDAVGAALSRLNISVMASNNANYFHLVGHVPPKAKKELWKLGALINGECEPDDDE